MDSNIKKMADSAEYANKRFNKKNQIIFAGLFVFKIKIIRTVKFLFYNDILTQNYDLDLTPYLVKRPIVEPMVRTKSVLINKNDTTENTEVSQTDEKFEEKKI